MQRNRVGAKGEYFDPDKRGLVYSALNRSSWLVGCCNRVFSFIGRPFFFKARSAKLFNKARMLIEGSGVRRSFECTHHTLRLNRALGGKALEPVLPLHPRGDPGLDQ